MEGIKKEEDATEALARAEELFKANDLDGAKKMALMAHSLYPSLPGLSQTLTAYGVHIAAKNSKPTTSRWHAVLNSKPSDDIGEVKRQYKKLCILIHPDKNRSAAADGAFKIISNAWQALSSCSTPTTAAATSSGWNPFPPGWKNPFVPETSSAAPSSPSSAEPSSSSPPSDAPSSPPSAASSSSSSPPSAAPSSSSPSPAAGWNPFPPGWKNPSVTKTGSSDAPSSSSDWNPFPSGWKNPFIPHQTGSSDAPSPSSDWNPFPAGWKECYCFCCGS